MFLLPIHLKSVGVAFLNFVDIQNPCRNSFKGVMIQLRCSLVESIWIFSKFSQKRCAKKGSPKTNVAPENRPSQNKTSIRTIHFRVLCQFQGGQQQQFFFLSLQQGILYQPSSCRTGQSRTCQGMEMLQKDCLNKTTSKSERM